MENDKRSLDEAIKAAQNSAKKGQIRFWILSISWVIVIIIVSIFSYNVLNDLDRTQVT
jgi:t-SNARE complex subunit (syntaxin)